MMADINITQLCTFIYLAFLESKPRMVKWFTIQSMGQVLQNASFKLHSLTYFAEQICFCSWLALTNPADVARVESRTFMCTRNKRDTVPKTMSGVKGTLGNWMSLEDMDKAIEERFPGCMEGKNIQ